MKPIVFTPFDTAAASKITHFDTYNRTAASQRIADFVRAARDAPGAAVVADGDAALAALLARAVVPIPAAVLDVGRFDTSSDAAYVDRLYIPGLRRAGDLQTAVALGKGTLVIHNAGDRFVVRGVNAQPGVMSVAEIVAAVKK